MVYNVFVIVYIIIRLPLKKYNKKYNFYAKEFGIYEIFRRFLAQQKRL